MSLPSTPRMLTRRRMLQLSGLSVAALASRTGFAMAADNGVHPRILWRPTSTSPAFTEPLDNNDPNTQRMFPTMLPARTLLGSTAIDDWYLWLWTHDTSRIYLYTAPHPTGPWTSRGWSSPPTSLPAGYASFHISSGDIVWDPDGHRFLSNPHSFRFDRDPANGEVCQDSFLIGSDDGVNWSWLDGDNSPRLVCGPPGSPDSVHTGYGRLLRDLDGHLYRFDDRYWWIYRAQRKDAPLILPDGSERNKPTLYRPWLASTASLATARWDKEGEAFQNPTGNTGLFDLGSFIRGGGQHYAFGAQGTALTFPTALYMNTTGVETMDFRATAQPIEGLEPGVGNALEGGINIVRDPATGDQFGVQVLANLPQNKWEIWVLRGMP